MAKKDDKKCCQTTKALTTSRKPTGNGKKTAEVRGTTGLKMATAPAMKVNRVAKSTGKKRR